MISYHLILVAPFSSICPTDPPQALRFSLRFTQTTSHRRPLPSLTNHNAFNYYRTRIHQTTPLLETLPSPPVALPHEDPASYLRCLRLDLLISELNPTQQNYSSYIIVAMKTQTKTLVLLAVVALISLVAWQNTKETEVAAARLLPAVTTYQTSATRTATVKNMCGTTARTSLYTQTDIDAASSYMAKVNSDLGIDGNKLFVKLSAFKLDETITMVLEGIQGVGIFVGVFALGLIVFHLIWPFLCCCCCCPSCCPSKCCQKSEDEQYSKCELYWPTITLILALLLVISISVYGFVNAGDMGPVFKNMGCSIAIFTDDILNGNVTSDGSSFFVGLNQFSAQLSTLSGSLGSIDTGLAELKNTTATSPMQDSLTACSNALTQIQAIPSGGGSGSSLTLSYTANPISGTTGGSFNSLFPAVLGSDTAAGTLVKGLADAVKQIQTFLTTMKASANTFSGQMVTITGQVSNIQGAIDGIKNTMSDADSSLNTYLGYLNYPGDYGSLGIQAFYGLLIAFSFFALLGALLTACCNKYGCRHLMYFSCLFLFLGALIGFLIAVLFSIIVPVMTWTCSYLQFSLSSSANFKTNLGSMLDAGTVDKIAVCIADGNGDLISKVAGSATNGLNNLTSVITNMGTYNPDEYIGYIDGNLTKAIDTIRKYAKGQIPDLDTSGANYAALRKVSQPSQYAGCTDADFVGESWVPSNSQDTAYGSIGCAVGSASRGNEGTCAGPNLGLAACAGCMDSTMILGLYTSSATLGTDLNTKYACAAWQTEMTNIWTHYYNVKKTALGPYDTVGAGSGVLHRALVAEATIKDNITTAGVFYSIYRVTTLFTTVKNDLVAVSSLTDPNYGLLAGLNCKLFGQDFSTLYKVTCGSFYKNVYLLRLTIGIACWGILFAMCCIVCTGVRHYKHSEREKKVGDAFFKNSFDEGSKRVLNTKH